jgi:competence protein ComEC
MRPAEPGQRWTVGGLSLTVLAPALHGPRVSTEDDGSTVNNVSVVMVARWAARAGGAGSSEKHSLGALLSGDVEEEAQRALVASVPPVDILKVPHHGSKKQDPAFLAATQARIAVISAGAGNDYGHPAPATLGLLSAFGHRTFRTDLAGSIAVVRTRSGIAVVPQNDAPS